MKLDEWMQRHGVTQTELANALDVYPNQIHNVLKGRYRPKADFAKKIRNYTKNAVTLDDIYDIPTIEERLLNREAITQNRDQLSIVPNEVLEIVCDKLIKLIQGKLDKPEEQINHCVRNTHILDDLLP